MRQKKQTWGYDMTTVVHLQPWDIEQRLNKLDLTRDKIIEIIRACVAGVGGCTDNDPPSAKGWQSWRWGVRRAREILRSEGWEKDDTGGFSTIVNHNKRIRIAVVNTDEGTSDAKRIPQNRSRKGPTTERCVSVNNLQLSLANDWFSRKPSDVNMPIDDYTTWHLCIYIEGDKVLAELSILDEFSSGHFSHCYERIFLIQDGDWETLAFKYDNNNPPPEINIEVNRK